MRFDWLDALRRVAWPIGEREELALWAGWLRLLPWSLLVASGGMLVLWCASMDGGIVEHIRSVLCENGDCGAYDYVIPVVGVYVSCVSLFVIWVSGQ